MVFLRRFRFPWIALAAFVGIVSATQDATAGPASRDRALAMWRSGCCCVTRPTSGCCCETSNPISLTSTPASESSRRATAGAGVPLDSRSGRTCQCRSADPARAPSNSESRGGDERPDSIAAESSAGLPVMAIPAPPTRTVSPHASPPKAPLYLRTARLLI